MKSDPLKANREALSEFDTDFDTRRKFINELPYGTMVVRIWEHVRYMKIQAHNAGDVFVSMKDGTIPLTFIQYNFPLWENIIVLRELS